MRNYAGKFKSFQAFCESRGLPDPKEVSEEMLDHFILFIQSMADPALPAGIAKFSTADQYKSGCVHYYVNSLGLIGGWDEQNKIGNPCRSKKVSDYFKALKKHKKRSGEVTDRTLPILE
jgi:hypothetical protein